MVAGPKNPPEIAVLDYGMGNRRSVVKALERVGARVRAAGDAGALRGADGIAIIGVGAFPEAMRRIDPFAGTVRELHAAGTPILGICLGLELFFESSEEHGGARGLGLLDGHVRRLTPGDRRLPHIGWNHVRWNKDSALLDGLSENAAFYHVHSYAAEPACEDDVLGWTSYGGQRFMSALESGSLYGVQFHPEKSGGHGLRLLHNFTRICAREGRVSRPVAGATAGGELCKRVIPCLDVDAGRVVKGTNFVDLRDAGDPIELAQRYDAQGADEITFLDITATHENRDTIAELARRAVDNVFVPITIGGGIRTVSDAQRVLDAGADNVSVNSAAVARPELIDELAQVFATQNLILALDAKRRRDGEGWEVHVAGGRTATGLDAVEWAHEAARRGVGQILLTSMDRDGTGAGYDTALIAAVADAAQIPVIASGGAGEIDHLAQALEAGADAVLLASLLHYGRFTVVEIKEELAALGVEVTPPIAAWEDTGEHGSGAAASSAPRSPAGPPLKAGL